MSCSTPESDMHPEDQADYVIHTAEKIHGFFGPYRFLSNFHLATIHFGGAVYLSVEHAFQAAKYPVTERHQFDGIKAVEAKKLGQLAKLNKQEWDKVKVAIMFTCVFDKFYRNSALRQSLLNTGAAHLEETNHGGDTFWGVCDGQGENKLGEILMEVRTCLSIFNNCEKYPVPAL